MRGHHLSMVRLIAIGLCLAFGSLAAATRAEEQAVAELSKLEDVWNRAHLDGDVQRLDRLWARDLVITVPGMAPMTKDDALQLWRSMKVTFSRYDTSDVKITVHEGAAVVTGRLHRTRNFGGRQADDNWLFTKSYARVDGRWQVHAYHASSAPEPR